MPNLHLQDAQLIVQQYGITPTTEFKRCLTVFSNPATSFFPSGSTNNFFIGSASLVPMGWESDSSSSYTIKNTVTGAIYINGVVAGWITSINFNNLNIFVNVMTSNNSNVNSFIVLDGWTFTV
jgi:hypothetical protein